ncbi:MAG: type II secretion system protein GspM [Rubrivivax sp.]
MTPDRATRWAAAFWLLLIAALAAWAVQAVLGLHGTAQQHLDTIEPRYARLTGLAADSGRLKDAASAADRIVERHAYPATRDASQAGNDAQQRVREVFSKGGLDVVSIQVLPARVHKQFDRIPISLRADGELAAMQATLAALPALSPSLFVEGFSFSGGNMAENAPARVVGELQLFVLRVRP